MADLGNWTCHICGADRPDALIHVARRPLANPPAPDARVNVRYCSDRPACITAARTGTHFFGTDVTSECL